MAEKTPIIQIENLNFYYDYGTPSETKVLKDVSFTIYKGEYAVFFGPSGCGKTSLTYLIGGIQAEKSSTGKITVNGQDVTNLTKEELAIFRQTGIGIIFQQFNLIPSLTVLDNVALPMAFVGIPQAERREEAHKLLVRLGMDKYASRFPTELSGGQQQRVGIARAIANNPPIIIADEPLGNLDSENAELVLAFLRELHEKDKRTIIMVTHEAWSVRDAERIIYIKDGAIVKLGEAVDKPLSEYDKTNQKKNENEEAKDEILGLDSERKGRDEEILNTFNNIEVANGNKGDAKSNNSSSTTTTETTRTPVSPNVFKELYPELSPKEIMIKTLSNLLLRDFSPEEIKRFESLLTKRIDGVINADEFKNLLDLPFNKEGLGLWRQRANKVASLTEDLIKEEKKLSDIYNQLERNPEKPIGEEVHELRLWILKEYKRKTDEIQNTRLDGAITERLRGNMTPEDFRKILTLPKSQLGIGFSIRATQHISERLESALSLTTAESLTNNSK